MHFINSKNIFKERFISHPFYYNMDGISEWHNIGHNDIHSSEMSSRKVGKDKFDIGWNDIKWTVTVLDNLWNN